MATYKKRGFKPKNKEEQQQFDEQESTTAEVFSTLDESASKSEEWVSKNQNYILGFIGVVAAAVLLYLGYDQFFQVPKEANASNELYYPQQYFDQAVNGGTQQDSLYNLALNGSEGKYGFLDIIDNYPGTYAANLATYQAGTAYMNMQKYEEAIDYLEDFSADDDIIAPVAKGRIGDAFMQLNQASEALGYYEQAFKLSTNDYSTPIYLYKAGIAALELKENDKALQYFQRIKDDFSSSDQARTIDAFIGMAKTGK
jgi:tetratricopeptide (TPR) repeat protein